MSLFERLFHSNTHRQNTAKQLEPPPRLLPVSNSFSVVDADIETSHDLDASLLLPSPLHLATGTKSATASPRIGGTTAPPPLPKSPPSLASFTHHRTTSSLTLPGLSFGLSSSYLTGDPDYGFANPELERLWMQYDEDRSSSQSKLEQFAQALLPSIACRHRANTGSLSQCLTHSECCKFYQVGGHPLRLLLRLKADLQSGWSTMKREVNDCIQGGKAFASSQLSSPSHSSGPTPMSSKPSTPSSGPLKRSISAAVARADPVALGVTLGPSFLPLYLLYRLMMLPHNRRILVRADIISWIVKICQMASTQYALSVEALVNAEKGEIDEFVEDGQIIEDEDILFSPDSAAARVKDRRRQLRRMQIYLESIQIICTAMCSMIADPTSTGQWRQRTKSHSSHHTRSASSSRFLSRASSVSMSAASSLSVSLAVTPASIAPTDSDTVIPPIVNSTYTNTNTGSNAPLQSMPSTPPVTVTRSTPLDDSGIVDVLCSILRLLSSFPSSRLTFSQVALVKSAINAAGSMCYENRKLQQLFTNNAAVESLCGFLRWPQALTSTTTEELKDENDASSSIVERNRVYQRRLIEALFGDDDEQEQSSSLTTEHSVISSVAVSPAISTNTSPVLCPATPPQPMPFFSRAASLLVASQHESSHTYSHLVLEMFQVHLMSMELMRELAPSAIFGVNDSLYTSCVRSLTVSVAWIAHTFAANIPITESATLTNTHLWQQSQSRVESLSRDQSEIESEDGFQLFSLAELTMNTLTANSQCYSARVSVSQHGMMRRVEQLDQVFDVLLSLVLHNDSSTGMTSPPSSSFFALFNKPTTDTRVSIPVGQLVLQALSDLFSDEALTGDASLQQSRVSLRSSTALPVLQCYTVELVHEAISRKSALRAFLRDRLSFSFLFSPYFFFLHHPCQRLMRVLVMELVMQSIAAEEAARINARAPLVDTELRVLLACYAACQSINDGSSIDCALAVIDVFSHYRQFASRALLSIINQTSVPSSPSNSQLWKPFGGIDRVSFTLDIPIPQLFTLVLARQQVAQSMIAMEFAAFLFFAEFAVFSSAQVCRALVRDGAFALQLLELGNGSDAERRAALRMTVIAMVSVGEKMTDYNLSRRASQVESPASTIGISTVAHRSNQRINSAGIDRPSSLTSMRALATPVSEEACRSSEDEELERSKRSILNKFCDSLPLLVASASPVIEDWLAAIRKLVAVQTRVHQDSLRRRHVIEHLTTMLTQPSVILTDTKEGNEPGAVTPSPKSASLTVDGSRRLCVSYLLTLTALIAGNHRSVEFFRRCLGFDRLARLVHQLEMDQPSRAVTAALLNVLVEGHFHVKGIDIRSERQQREAETDGDNSSTASLLPTPAHSVQPSPAISANPSRRGSQTFTFPSNGGDSNAVSITSRAAMKLRATFQTRTAMPERFTFRHAEILTIIFSLNRFPRCSHQLQLDLLSLFIKLLSVSSVNTALAAKVSLVDRVLNLLPHLTPLTDTDGQSTGTDGMHEKAIELIKQCGSYGITARQLRRLINLTETETITDTSGNPIEVRQSYTRAILEAIEWMSSRSDPKSYFLLDGVAGGLALPPLTEFPSNGWSLATWVRIESFQSITANTMVATQSLNYSVDSAELTNSLPQSVFHRLNPTARLAALNAYRSTVSTSASTPIVTPSVAPSMSVSGATTPRMRTAAFNNRHPRLLQLLTASKQGHGIEIFFTDRRLTISVCGGKGRGSTRLQLIENSVVRENQWYFIAVTQSSPTITNSAELKVFIDSQCVYQSQSLPFPSVSQPLTHCFVGTSGDAKLNRTSHIQCLNGAIGPVLVFDDSLGPDEVSALYTAGPDFLTTANTDSQPTCAESEADSLTHMQDKLLLAYTAKARDGRSHFNLCPRYYGKDKLKEAETQARAIDGTYQCVTRHCVDSLESIEGVANLFPLLHQLDQPVKQWRKLTESEMEQRLTESQSTTPLSDSPPAGNSESPRSVNVSIDCTVAQTAATPSSSPSRGHSHSSSISWSFSPAPAPSMPLSPRASSTAELAAMLDSLPSPSSVTVADYTRQYAYDIVEEFDPKFLVSLLRCFACALDHRPSQLALMQQSRGFEFIATQLERSSRAHLTVKAVRAIDELLAKVRVDAELHRQAFFAIACNLSLWIPVPVTVQRHWLRSMAMTVVRDPSLVREGGGFQFILDQLRIYCWFDPDDSSIFLPGDRPLVSNLHTLRAEIASIANLALTGRGQSSLQLQSSMAPVIVASHSSSNAESRLSDSHIRQLMLAIQCLNDAEQLVELTQLLYQWLESSENSSLVVHVLNELDLPLIDVHSNLESRLSQRTKSVSSRGGIDILLSMLDTPVPLVRATALHCLHTLLQKSQAVSINEKDIMIGVFHLLLDSRNSDMALDQSLYYGLLSLMIDVSVNASNVSDVRQSFMNDSDSDGSAIVRVAVLPVILSLVALRRATLSDSVSFLQDVSFLLHSNFTTTLILDQWSWPSWLFALMCEERATNIASYARSMLHTLLLASLENDRGFKQFERCLSWLSMFKYLPTHTGNSSSKPVTLPHLPKASIPSHSLSLPVFAVLQSMLTSLHAALIKESETHSMSPSTLTLLIANIEQLNELIECFVLYHLTEYCRSLPSFIDSELSAVWSLIELMLDFSAWVHTMKNNAGEKSLGIDGQLLMTTFMRVARCIELSNPALLGVFLNAPSSMKLATIIISMLPHAQSQTFVSLASVFPSLSYPIDKASIRSKVDRFYRCWSYLADLNESIKNTDVENYSVTKRAMMALKQQHREDERQRRLERPPHPRQQRLSVGSAAELP